MSERKRIFVGLKGKTGRFYDPVTKFRIKLDEVKELQYPLGELTRQWLNAGGLIIAPLSTLPPQEPPGVISEKDSQQELLSVPEIEQAIKPPDHDKFDYMDVRSLRALAKKQGVKLSRTDTAQRIREKLRTA